VAILLVVTASDGSVFRGRSAQAVVRQMKRNQWSAPSRKREYMEEVAERIFAARGIPIRTDPASFLRDLADAGLLEIRLQVEMREHHARELLEGLHLAELGEDVEHALAEAGW
jgi:hypothetical protein